jgi:hypothetical protein
MTDSLLDRTRQLLRACHLSRPEIARRAGVGYEWLKKFASGAVRHPTVTRVQALYDYLVQVNASSKRRSSRGKKAA